jgi:hypothetical protein
MNDLLDSLDQIGVDSFAYADDIAILSKDAKQLSKAISIVENWSQHNLMKINKDKSGIMFLHAQRLKLTAKEINKGKIH